VHCENAPCEVVCPVNATVHGREGTNNMAYNRCIGTRYCSNNCPYKVRRFNWFDYAVKEFNGESGERIGAAGELIDKAPAIASENFIPPRLREKIKEVRTLQYNPHVTVRSRGLMEKCTYCIQRVNEARVESKLEDLPIIPDGYVQTACQAACPTQAITFGDIYDHDSNGGAGSAVSREMRTQRAYALLAYLNTRPRTLHLMRLRNPNKALLEAMGDGDRVASWDDPFHKDDHGGYGDGHGSEDHTDETHSGIRLPVLNNAEVLA
jgi:molybdopterin-containing oxidoreductase family iron-sulfur binding subunit